MAATITKTAQEQYGVAIEFSGKLPAATGLAAATMSAVNTATNLDATPVVLASAVGTISGTQVSFFVQGGVIGQTYRITAVVTLTPGTPVPTLVETVNLVVVLAL